MALVRITPEAVARYCQDKEITSIARDKISDIIREVCNEVAAAVNSCPRNARIAMDSSSVPAELVFTTCILVRDAVTSSRARFKRIPAGDGAGGSISGCPRETPRRGCL